MTIVSNKTIITLTAIANKTGGIMQKAFMLVALLFLTTSTALAREWYEGGTLSRATIGQWHAANYNNRLATSADFVAVLKNVKTMTQLKTRAVAMEQCITTATSDKRTYSQKVADMAVLCAIQLGYNK